MQNDNLIKWLTDPRTAEYFGKTWRLRAQVLDAVITGGNLSAVALENGVSKQYVHRQAVRARAIFFGQRPG